MSLADDARQALRTAIQAINGVDIRPDEFSQYKPSDPAIGAQDGAAWLTTLNRAVRNLRGLGHKVAEPDIDKATELQAKTLTSSSLYLQNLAVQPEKAPSLTLPLALIAIVAILLGIFAFRTRAQRKDEDDQ